MEQRLEHLEASFDALWVHNRVLWAALSGTLKALPIEMAQEVAESIHMAFEDEWVRLDYANSPHRDAFQDAADAFFREKL